jgi:hypothetical protein
VGAIYTTQTYLNTILTLNSDIYVGGLVTET